ncbi:FAD-binding domain-containing protein [Auriscalpium vulgare]|uniref:FAD-binding domain-containing protein n=1 Tax=Auriscalpium vulgare TaxID=40419 RepID=A0ACB8S957_9AGAM|nr:FAD-binding domain-containing protein [Auriscalpium vulgare]
MLLRQWAKQSGRFVAVCRRHASVTNAHSVAFASTSTRTTSATSLPSRLVLALGGSLLGAAGYYIGTISTGHHADATAGKKPVYGTPGDFARAIKELKAAFPLDDVVTTDPDDLSAHGISPNTWHPGNPHTVVVYPTSTEEVVKVVKIANKYRMPVIPYSGGTALEGHFLGREDGGICVDVSRMDKIIEIHEADSDLVCQPGVGWMEVNETLKDKGIPLFFPIDPGPTATIGGMLSTGCSGTNAVRYGTAKGEWFLNATIVLPSGEVIKTRKRSRKSSAGFDVTKLFIGAEGTLGIVTEVTIRLAPLLPTTVATVQFPNVRKATEAVIDILTTGVGIQCVELTDAKFMHATNIYGSSNRQYEVADHLFFKLQGPSEISLKESARIVKEVAAKHGGTRWTLAKDADEANTMWTDRKNALYSGLAYGGEGAKAWSTDVCVPISQLPELVYATQKDIEQSGIKYTIVGHVGDGNFHALLLFKTDEELNTVRHLVHRMVERAIALDGTCTGEHGVGVGKKEFLKNELGEGTVRLMKTIKQAIDPLGLFNPGKVCASMT